MLNEEKIKLMISLAEYEKGIGRVDLYRMGFYKVDYVRTKVFRTVICVTVAFAFLFSLFFFYHLETWLMNAFLLDYQEMGMQLLILFFLVQLLFIIITVCTESVQYEESMKRVRIYYRNLSRFMEYYEEEKSE